MKIFLAGATGAIGRLLVPLLLEAGHEVAGTTRSPDKTDQIAAMGARPVIADALDRQSIFAALEAEHPDVVIHQLTDLSSRDFAGNSRLRVEGTRNLVDAALAVGVGRMIAQSISWVYVPGHTPAVEDEALDFDASPSRNNTVTAVNALESAVAEMPVGISLRYGLFYGPGTWYTSDGLTSDQVRRGELKATPGITSFVHVADAAQAALLALDWPAGVVNIVDDEPAAGSEWLPLYANLVGAPPPATEPTSSAWERGASNAKARRLSWQPQFPSWRDGFKTVLT